MRLQSTRDGCAVSARSGVKQKSREQQRGQQQRGEGGTSAATLSGFTGGDGGGAGGGGVGAGEGGAGCLGPLKHTKANCDHGGSRQTPDPVKTLNTTRAKIFILIISSKFHKNRISPHVYFYPQIWCKESSTQDSLRSHDKCYSFHILTLTLFFNHQARGHEKPAGLYLCPTLFPQL